jgi:hypothetical protein
MKVPLFRDEANIRAVGVAPVSETAKYMILMGLMTNTPVSSPSVLPVSKPTLHDSATCAARANEDRFVLRIPIEVYQVMPCVTRFADDVSASSPILAMSPPPDPWAGTEWEGCDFAAVERAMGSAQEASDRRLQSVLTSNAWDEIEA